MALITRTAPSRRSLLPAFDELEETDPLGLGRPPIAPSRPALTAEADAANARFADAIRGTSNYDDAARTVLSDFEYRGERAAQSLQNVLDHLHERDPGAAAAFAGSIRRLADGQSAAFAADRTGESTVPSSNLKRTIGHYLFPGQIAVKKENLWAEAGADIIPLVGNLRSASYAAQDIKDAVTAIQEGDYSAAAGHGAWALFDAAGAVPGAGNVLAAGRPLIRNALRATPGVRHAHASWTLAKAARQFDKRISVKPEKLYGELWPDLPALQQEELKRLQRKITGFSGEEYTDELLTSSGFHHQGDRKIRWGNPTRKPRVYDSETAEQFRTIFFGLFAVPSRSTGARSLYEVKTAGGKLSKKQKEADAVISSSESLVYLRQHLDQIPFEFLSSQTNRLLKESKVRFSQEQVENLVSSMRRAQTPEGKPFTTMDWFMAVARIAAETARAESEEAD